MAFLKPKREIKEETVRRVCGGIFYSGRSNRKAQQFEARLQQASRRMLTKIVLDEIGLKDRAKRQRVHRLVEKVSIRLSQLEAEKRKPEDDSYFKGIVEELEAEIGGRKEYGKFQRYWNRFRKQLDLIEEKILEG